MLARTRRPFGCAHAALPRYRRCLRLSTILPFCHCMKARMSNTALSIAAGAASTSETAAQKQFIDKSHWCDRRHTRKHPWCSWGRTCVQVCAAQAMAASVAAAHEETVQRLSTALTACCADFQAAHYTQVSDHASISRLGLIINPQAGTMRWL